MKRFFSVFPLLILCFLLLALKHGAECRLSALSERAPNLVAQAARYHGESLRRYSLGFDFVIADLLWLRLLDQARHQKLEQGKVSWEFAQLDAITTLDHKFYQAYPFGSSFLSVFLRDTEGARLLLEKWIKFYPTSWKAHYVLGYHLYFEMRQFKPAAEHILIAADLEGAPYFLTSLGIRLLSETGSIAQTLRMAVSLIPALKDAGAKTLLLTRIRGLIYSLQKAGWQAALEAYRQDKKAEPPSLLAVQPRFISQTRELASVLALGEIPEEVRPLFAEAHSFRYDPKEMKIVPIKSDPVLEHTGIYSPEGT